MASDYGGPYRLHSTHILHSPRISQPLCSDRYLGHELGRRQYQHLQGDQHGLSTHPHPHPHPQPRLHPHSHPLSSAQSHDLHEAILREIEKERIRQEIIMSEIHRRHVLEAEVRRELMMEREMALQGGSNGFHFGSPSTMALNFPMRLPLAEARVEERCLEERIRLPLTQRNILNNTHEHGGSSLPFQRASNDVRTARNSVVKPALEGSNEKKKIILQAKPIVNITGAKRARSGSGASESQSDGNLKKKAKEDWSCAICQVSTTNERLLNEHLEGKKHKKKEASLRAQKAGRNSRTGLSSNKVAKSVPVTDCDVKLASESSPFGKSEDASSQTNGNLNSDDLTKDVSVVPQEVQKNDKPKKEMYKFWCEICQVGASNQQVMDTHKQGKKHNRRLKTTTILVQSAHPIRRKGAVEETVAKNAGAVKETVGENDVTMVDVADEP